jgi:hypothetical protein
MGVTSLITTQGFNWRIELWMHTSIVIVNALARTLPVSNTEFTYAA